MEEVLNRKEDPHEPRECVQTGGSRRERDAPRIHERSSFGQIIPADYESECLRSQLSAVSATTRQPLSIVSEWPRPGISMRSVTAGDLRYCWRVALVITGGTV